MDDLLRHISQTGTYIQGYADDIVLMVQGKFIDTVVDVINNSLLEVSRWCNRVGLRVNAAKTVIVPFTLKRNLNSLARIRLNNVQLAASDKVKYLGVVLDKRLTWNDHVDAATHKAKWAIMTSRSFIGKTWGLKPKMAMWLYTAVIRPLVSYAALVWWTKTQQITVKVKLDSLQRMACLSISGAFISTSTAALEVILNVTPLDLYLKQEAVMSFYRLSVMDGTRRSLARTGHLSALEQESREPLLAMGSDLMLGKFMFARPFTTHVGTRRDWENGLLVRLNNSLIWYTDGSLINGKAGYGAHRHRPKCNLSGSLGRWCTVFQAEVFAIAIAAQEELLLGTRDKHITIYSDSQAALKALEGYRFTSKLVWDCVQTLRDLSSRNIVHLEWIPGHQGFEGNERADLLARKGALSRFNGPEPVVGISPTIVRSFLKGRTAEAHRLRWINRGGTSVSDLLLRGPSGSSTNSILILNRIDLRFVIAYLTGHGHFRNHLLKTGQFQGNPVCRLCESSTETARHVLLDCPSLEIRRRGLLEGREWDELNLSQLGAIIVGLCKATGVGLPS